MRNNKSSRKTQSYLNKEFVTPKEYDPRIKILSVMILTGVIIFNSNLWVQTCITLLSFGLGIFLKANIIGVFKKMKRFLILFFSLVIIQSLFRQSGQVYIHIGSVSILTEEGVIMAISYVFRVAVIILSGAIISTSSMRNVLQGMVQMKLPYVLGLMTSIGIRFMPILMEEIQNAYTSMELRGINVKKLSIKRRMELIGRLFVPIVYSALIRAKKLSESIEMRGFVIGGQRSSYYNLKFKVRDFVVLATVIVSTLMILQLERLMII